MLDVVGGYLMPAAEVLGVLFHEFAEEVDVLVLIEHFNVEARAILRENLHIDLMDVPIQQAHQRFLSQKALLLYFPVCYQPDQIILQDKFILPKLNRVLFLTAVLHNAFAHVLIDLGDDLCFPLVDEGDKIVIGAQFLLIGIEELYDLLEVLKYWFDVAIAEDVCSFDPEHLGNVALVPEVHYVQGALHISRLYYLILNPQAFIINMLGEPVQRRSLHPHESVELPCLCYQLPDYHLAPLHQPPRLLHDLSPPLLDALQQTLVIQVLIARPVVLIDVVEQQLLLSHYVLCELRQDDDLLCLCVQVVWMGDVFVEILFEFLGPILGLFVSYEGDDDFADGQLFQISLFDHKMMSGYNKQLKDNKQSTIQSISLPAQSDEWHLTM